MPDSVTYRVMKLFESLLTAVREKRDQVETTNVRFLTEVVDTHLSDIVVELQRLGIGLHGGNQQVARFPLSEESATLILLKEATEKVGLPSTKLLELCLFAAVQPHTKPKRRRRRSKSVKTVEKKPGRPR